MLLALTPLLLMWVITDLDLFLMNDRACFVFSGRKCFPESHFSPLRFVWAASANEAASSEWRVERRAVSCPATSWKSSENKRYNLRIRKKGKVKNEATAIAKLQIGLKHLEEGVCHIWKCWGVEDWIWWWDVCAPPPLQLFNPFFKGKTPV